jgi:hypothetical protein
MRRIVLLLSLMALLPVVSAAAQGDSRCFPETGQCISGPIRAYWERNGGLPIFGYPIGALQEEAIHNDDGSVAWVGPVQWFERDRLEDHGAEGAGVLAGRLGAEQLHSFSYQPLLPRPAEVDGPAAAGCRYFPLTRHSLCPPYLTYWEHHGGLMRFGYPISEPFTMTMGPWRGEVQYFERRRMERHPDLPSTPLLLGLLGHEQREHLPSATCAVSIDPVFGDYARTTYGMVLFLAGCPVTAQREVALVDQPFERGVMVWAGAFGGNRIYAIRGIPLPVTWTSYTDTWMNGQPEGTSLSPPQGMQAPVHGFGKVWREQPGVRENLGWATAPERRDTGVIQPYTNGAIIYMQGSNFLYIFGPNGMTWAFSTL